VRKLSTIQKVVHSDLVHKPPVKEMVAVKKSKQPEVIVRCIGERKEPSKVAVDRFISIYLEMVKENQNKLANQK
jgi:hypothetical protein